MNRFGSPSEEYQPITWFRGYPIYATHLIVAAYVGSMIATSILMALGVNAIFSWLAFDTIAVFKGQLWRYFTYGLLNPASIWPFTIDMLWLFMFGREVEKFLGRATFLRFYAALYLVTPLLFTVLGIWWPLVLAGETGCFAVFVAFATLHPEAELMFGVLAKWAAVILFGVLTLIALQYHDFSGLLSLWATVGFAYVFIRHRQGNLSLPRLNFWRRKPKLRVLPDLEAEDAVAVGAAKPNPMAEVDALLDKIARSGISSLTAKERAKLDRARDDLKNRGSRRS